MPKKWIILCIDYADFTALAVNRISGALLSRAGYLPSVYTKGSDLNADIYESHSVICLSCSDSLDMPRDGYSITVTPLDENDRQTINITGSTELGLLYGAVDFVNRYLGIHFEDYRGGEITYEDHFDNPMQKPIPRYSRTSSPKFDMRGIWTWGHCIYDYRRFFDNMLSLKLNHVVIWNDHAPINAKAVVDYAHSRGISVYWGFSWGWSTNCAAPGYRIDSDEVIDEWADKIVAQYRDDYAPSGADGIYFQSFTETSRDEIDGVSIAEAVVKWVNRNSGRLFAENPALEIQFGLHAESVRHRLDALAKVDSRVRIVWENCGAFPFAYSPRETDNLDGTSRFNAEIASLRGEGEKFGAVYKGMTKLDWSRFEHTEGRLAIGEADGDYIAARSVEKDKIWRRRTVDWVKNIEYVRRLVAETAEVTDGHAAMQMLVEDGCFEQAIKLPVALCAELLWDSTDVDIVRNVSLFPCVKR